VIQNALNETFSADVHIRFESAPDLVSGIELAASGQKVGWSIDGYLASMEGGIDDLLKEKAKDDKAKDDKAKDDKAKDDKAKDDKAKDVVKDDRAKDDKTTDVVNDDKGKDKENAEAKDQKPEGTAEPIPGAPEVGVKSQ
jgi:F-type H+-transporting ATPase subunit b